MRSRQDKKTRIFSAGVRLFLSAFFIIFVAAPLFTMLFNMRNADFAKIFSGGKAMKAIVNSICVSLTATVISVVLALLCACAIERSAIRLKGLFHTLIMLPMLIPSISHGMGLIILFGDNGRLTKLFGLSHGIYGFVGIVVGSVMYAFPVAYMMLVDVLRYEDSTPYEAARVLGIPLLRRFTSISLPYLKKPLISVVFATFTLIITDYGVPLMIGGMYKTLPVLMYEEVIGRQDFAKGSVFGAILLIPALIAFLVDLFFVKNKKGLSVARGFTPKPSLFKDGLSYIFLGTVSLCAVYPIISFIMLSVSNRYPSDMSFTVKHIMSTFSKGADEYLVNSLVIALFTALIGSLFAFLCAYFTSREKGMGSGFLHLMSILSLAIPGMVLGLSYVIFFSGSFIYGGIVLLVMANTVHFFSSPYLMLYNSMGKLSPNLEAVGDTLGISRIRIMTSVVLMQTLSSVVEVFSYFFVNSMMTISAVAFLANLRNKPISLMIPQFEAQMLLESAAFVSLLILAANLFMKGLTLVIKKILRQRKGIENVDQKAV